MENWAGNVKWTPQEVLLPKSEEEIADIIKKATFSGKTIRTVGSNHSFSPLLATTSVSLFASAIAFPIFIAASVGLSPA